MPIKKSAIKALKVSQRQSKENATVRASFKRAIKVAQAASDKTKPQAFKRAQSVIDKAVKNHVIHKKRGARLKSRLAKSLNKS